MLRKNTTRLGSQGSTQRIGSARRGFAILLALLVLMAACSSGDDSSSSATSAEAIDGEQPQLSAGDVSGDEDFGLADDQAVDEEVAADSDNGGTDIAQDDPAAEAVAPDDGEAATIPPPTTASTGERIIKEGTVTVQIEPGNYDTAFSQIVSRAQALGGHVSGTASSTNPGPDDTTLTSGQVTVRIPVRNFEDLLTSLGDAGEVVDRNITSQDVTAEFTDLESRRRNLQAQERFYLGLLEEAADVTDAIAVQQQLDGIQSQIEQITGRLNLLEDRTSFSTLTVLLNERGATVDEPVEEEPGGLAPYIDQAIQTLIATVGGLIVVATFLSPFIIILVFAYIVWRTVWRRRKADEAPQTVPQSYPAGPPPTPEAPRESVDA